MKQTRIMRLMLWLDRYRVGMWWFYLQSAIRRWPSTHLRARIAELEHENRELRVRLYYKVTEDSSAFGPREEEELPQPVVAVVVHISESYLINNFGYAVTTLSSLESSRFRLEDITKAVASTVERQLRRMAYDLHRRNLGL